MDDNDSEVRKINLALLGIWGNSFAISLWWTGTDLFWSYWAYRQEHLGFYFREWRVLFFVCSWKGQVKRQFYLFIFGSEDASAQFL